MVVNPTTPRASTDRGRRRDRWLTRATALAVACSAAITASALYPAAASAATAGSTDASSNLQVKYDFNDGTGTTAADSSGNGYNGTLENGAAFTASGKNFGGLVLGSGDLSIPNAALQGLHDITLSENIDLTTPVGSNHTWLATLGYNSGRYLGIDIEGAKLITYYVDGGKTYTATGAPPTVGQWTNVALVLSSTNETMSLYVDGALQNTTTGLTGDFSSLYESTQTVGGWISKNVWGNPALPATIDDFRLYNTALSADQVAAVADDAPISPATATQVDVSTAPGVAPSLPATADVPDTDGTAQTLPVDWNAIDPSQYAKAGSFTVNGTTNTIPALSATATVAVLTKATLKATGETASTVKLKWGPESGASHYSLYRSTTSGSGYSLVYQGDATSFTDKGLVTGTTYYYVATYTTTLGTSLNSDEVKATTVTVKVAAPSGITLLGSYPEAIDLSWTGVPGADSVNLYRSSSANGRYTRVAGGLTAGTYNNTGLTEDTTYYYELASVNGAGEGKPSAPFKATTDPGTSTVITNQVGAWYDVDGQKIDAGSGDIVYYQGTYYLYGSASTGPFDVNAYSSTDLVHWTFRNQIITTGKTLGADGEVAADLQASSGNHFERVKVQYDAATKQFVFLAHYENAGYTLAEVGTAFSATPTGDFTWDHAIHPAGLDCRDETTFVDNDGTGYLICASGGFDGQGTDVNSHVTLFQLTPDYLSVAKQMYNIYGGADDSGIYSGREAPAMVYSDGYYYFVTSEASGWYPSPAMYSVAKADSLADTTASSWTGDTNVDASGGWDGGGMAYYLGNRNDFGGQSVYILPVTGTKGTSFLYMNDTLDPQNSGTSGPMWLPLQLDNGVATVNYSQQVSIDTKTGEISNVHPGTLISQGKPATASLAPATTDSDGKVNANGWNADYANDGDYDTEYIASSVAYPWSWQVDLGQEYVINDTQLSWWMIGGSEAAAEYTIDVSDDGSTWTTAYSNMNDQDYGFNDVQLGGVEGRYVKVTVYSDPTHNTGASWYTPQLYEAQVYGTPAPNSATTTTTDLSGDYSLQVPTNIGNYPATGGYTLNLGPASTDYNIADLLDNPGHGTLTASNDVVSSTTLSAISELAGKRSSTVDSFTLGLTGADGTPIIGLGSPAVVTVHLTAAQVAALSKKGTPEVDLYDPAQKTLTKQNATFDLTAATVTYAASTLGTYVIARTTGRSAGTTITASKALVISDTASVGKSMTVTPGSYSVSGVTVTYQWLRNGVPIEGATTDKHTITTADLNSLLSVKVTASRKGYTSASTTTAPTAKFTTGRTPNVGAQAAPLPPIATMKR